jgi:hypothetical protein
MFVMEEGHSWKGNSRPTTQEIIFFHETWRFITLFTGALTGPYSEPDDSSQSYFI